MIFDKYGNEKRGWIKNIAINAMVAVLEGDYVMQIFFF